MEKFYMLIWTSFNGQFVKSSMMKRDVSLFYSAASTLDRVHENLVQHPCNYISILRDHSDEKLQNYQKIIYLNVTPFRTSGYTTKGSRESGWRGRGGEEDPLRF